MDPNLRKCFSAVVSGNLSKLQDAIGLVNVNQGKGEHTLLHAAAETGNVPIVKFILQYKADVNVKDKNEMTPLQVAIERKNFEVYQLLKSAGTDLESSDKSGARALHWSVQTKDLQITKDLLESNVEVAPKAKFDSIPLHLSARVGSLPIMKLLIEYKSPIDTTTKGHTALHLVSMKGFTTLMEELFTNGADIECKNNRQSTPLHLAATAGKQEAFSLLLANNANPNAIDTDGNTPVDIARTKGYENIVKLVDSQKEEATNQPKIENKNVPQKRNPIPPQRTPLILNPKKGNQVQRNPTEEFKLPDKTVALALHPYNQSIFKDQHREGDLSFTAGSVITDIKEDQSGWWEGTCKNVRGTFPSNYVSNTPIGKAKCIHNYYASKPDELNIKKGEDIAIYERRGSGWLRVICNGKGGLIPPTHIRELKANSTLAPMSPSPARSVSPYPGGGSPHNTKPKFTQAPLKKPSVSPMIRPNAQPAATPPPGTTGPPPATTGPPPPATTGPPPMPATTGPPPMPSNASNFKQPPKARPSPKPAPSTPKARVLYAYAAQHPGDLELTVGTIVELTKTEGGWWEGVYNGARGIFPANYVERI